MGRFFYELGRRAGPKVRTGRWWWSSLTGDRGQRLEAEEAVGRDLAAALEEELVLDADPEIQRFVEEVGDHLVAQVADSGRSFRFRVLAGGEVNAFALPGGFVYVERRLLEVTGWTAGEVAFVLGHEMAHVLLEHALRRLVTEGVLSAALKVLPPARILGRWVNDKGRAFLGSAHAREREEEADEKGLLLARAAGFPPGDGARMLTRLRDLEGRPGILDPYFSSHPPLERRVARLQRLERRVAARQDPASEP